MPAFENAGYNAIYNGCNIILSAFLQFNLKIVSWNYFFLFQRDMHICEKKMSPSISAISLTLSHIFFPRRQSQSYASGLWQKESQ